jgi:hypothetical protein
LIAAADSRRLFHTAAITPPALLRACRAAFFAITPFSRCRHRHFRYATLYAYATIISLIFAAMLFAIFAIDFFISFRFIFHFIACLPLILRHFSFSPPLHADADIFSPIFRFSDAICRAAATLIFFLLSRHADFRADYFAAPCHMLLC